MDFFEDMEKSLLEAIEVEKGNVPTRERNGMSATTFYIPSNETKLTDELVEMRKTENISQAELAKKII